MRTQREAAATNEVKIVSRYGIKRERDVLARVLAAMRWQDRRLIESVLVDSKTSWMVEVTLREWNADNAERIADMVDAGMIAENHGHNGVSVVGPGWSDRVFVGSCWDDLP